MGGVGVGGRKRIYAKKKAGYVLHEGGQQTRLGGTYLVLCYSAAVWKPPNDGRVVNPGDERRKSGEKE